MVGCTCMGPQHGWRIAAGDQSSGGLASDQPRTIALGLDDHREGIDAGQPERTPQPMMTLAEGDRPC